VQRLAGRRAVSTSSTSPFVNDLSAAQCGEEKPRAEFSRGPLAEHGRAPWCEACMRRETRGTWPSTNSVGHRRTAGSSEPRAAVTASRSDRTPSTVSEDEPRPVGTVGSSEPRTRVWGRRAIGSKSELDSPPRPRRLSLAPGDRRGARWQEGQVRQRGLGLRQSSARPVVGGGLFL
jgi:hypothetical protein